jgi:murein L,D-transpeptidase YcbB/YkuD
VSALACANPAVPHSLRADRDVEVTETCSLHATRPDVAPAIRARLQSGQVFTAGPLTAAELIELRALYEPGSYRPLWTDRDGRPAPSAHDAMRLLGDAAADGLDPADYGVAQLERLKAAAGAASPASEDLAAFDLELSAAALRYFRHLHLGRVNPRAIGFRLTLPAHDHDFVALLRSAVAGNRMNETAAGLAPPLAQYRALRTMLAQYRSLASDSGPETDPGFTETVRPGDAPAWLALLHRRLVALGDLQLDAPPPAGRYEGSIVEGVQRFQTRHGLDADGVLGKATQAALRVPLAWRIRQIELALERLRWLPDLGDRRFVALNIPMFHLWVWDSIAPSGAPAFGMRAIVGRAVRTRTPVFVEEMGSVIFRPYWNVPRSILLNEILPLVERDPDYLRRHDMEIVRGDGDDALPVAGTDENLVRLRRGDLRLRQRPGPQNALGLVKFVFPNDENVYLHGTPAQHLFSQPRRDFSHGCVRVQDPVALAEWVLGRTPGWTRNRILAAMAGPRSQRVDLSQPIQVVLFYVTAVVMPENGTIHFADDIYGHDVKLDRALARHSSE